MDIGFDYMKNIYILLVMNCCQYITPFFYNRSVGNNHMEQKGSMNKMNPILTNRCMVT